MLFINKLITLIIALLGISLIITVHELGHFTFCKLFKVATPLFSIGFGPPLLKKKIGNTLFVVSALPFGGYVQVAGMDEEFDGPESLSFKSKPYYQKVLILMGGILFNILFGLLLLLIYKLFSPPKDSSNIITDEPLTQPSSKKTYFTGPIGIIHLLGKSLTKGFAFYCLMIAIISFNLAAINILPLPIFDGGQLILYSLETLGYPLSLAVKELVFSVSWALILGLMFLITTFDIMRIFKRS